MEMNEKAKEQCFNCEFVETDGRIFRCKKQENIYSAYFSQTNGSSWYFEANSNGLLTPHKHVPCLEINKDGNCPMFRDRHKLLGEIKCPICGNMVPLE